MANKNTVVKMAFNEFITYEMVYNDVVNLLIPQLPRDIDAVIGIPRSGMIPATIISTELNIPLGVLGCDDFFGGCRMGDINSSKIRKVLLVDDSVNNGEALKTNREKIIKLESKYEVIRACVYMRKGKEKYVSVFAKYLDIPRIFEWNLFNSKKIKNMVFDLDGVFCKDPEVFDDDGEAYQDNIRNAIPLHIPTRPIKAICTSRLEKWRGITEEWLKKYNIRYEKLIMMDFPNAKTRRKKGNKVAYKAKHYLELDGSLFVESSTRQAKGIAKASKRKVLCLQDKKIY